MVGTKVGTAPATLTGATNAYRLSTFTIGVMGHWPRSQVAPASRRIWSAWWMASITRCACRLMVTRHPRILRVNTSTTNAEASLRRSHRAILQTTGTQQPTRVRITPRPHTGVCLASGIVSHFGV